MSRDDLLQANAEVVRQVVGESSRRSPNAFIIVVTNPMDVMAQLAWKVSGFDHRKVIGMGGVLDSARFRTFVSLDLGVSVSDVEALVMGGHGDQMVPMPRFTTVKGVPITKLLSPEKITSIIDRTRNGGAEIVSLLKAGSAYYAPAAATYQMLRAILFDERRILPCAAYLTGQYGVRNTYVGVPAVLGKNGVEQVIELELNKQEKKDFDKSLSAVTTLLEKIAI
jgi:malate dehydrogenase